MSPTSISFRAPRPRFAGVARRTRLGHRPGRGRGLAVAIAEHFDDRLHHAHLHAPHVAQGLCARTLRACSTPPSDSTSTRLQPTYELRVGVPGASAGINIAQRLGLNPRSSMRRAKRLPTDAGCLKVSSTAFTPICARLETERADLRTREQELEREQNRLAAEGAKSSRPKCARWRRSSRPVSRFRIPRARSRKCRSGPRRRAEALERRRAPCRQDASRIPRTIRFHRRRARHRRRPRRSQRAAHVVQHVTEGDTVKLKSVGRDRPFSARSVRTTSRSRSAR